MIKLKSNEVLEPYDYMEEFMSNENNRNLYEVCDRLGESEHFYRCFRLWELTQPIKFVIRNVDDDRVKQIMEDINENRHL